MDPADVTELLARLEAGDEAADAQLFQVAYDELRAAARRAMQGERAGHTLQTTALVHEAWMRLGGAARTSGSRAHFLALAARAMRRVLVDHARARGAAKRGGDAQREALDEAVAVFEQDGTALLDLDDALQRLQERDARMAEIVELRFFGGLTLEEVGRRTGLGKSRVHELWGLARAWLHRELSRM